MKEPTPELVCAFWKFMTQHYNTTVVDKASAIEMQIASSVLGALHILDPSAFLQHYTTTIGRRIYCPFTPGDASTPGGSLFEQLVVCTHEHEHVVQSDTLGAVTYSYRYLTSTASRTRLEAEAYRASLELSWWRNKTLPDIGTLANCLKGYGVTDTDIATAKAILMASAKSVRQGAIVNPASAVAIAWLNTNAPELRAA